MRKGVSTRVNSTLMMRYSGFGESSPVEGLSPIAVSSPERAEASCWDSLGRRSPASSLLADERLRRVASFGRAERTTGPMGPKPMPGYAPYGSPGKSPGSICGPCDAGCLSAGTRSADPSSWKGARPARPHSGQHRTTTRSAGMIIGARRPMARPTRRDDDDDDDASAVDDPRRRPRSSVAGESLLLLVVPSEGNRHDDEHARTCCGAPPRLTPLIHPV